MRPISGGLLLQVSDRLDAPGDDPATWTLATGEPLDAAGLADLVFAWRAVRAVKSNAILLAAERRHGRRRHGPGQPGRLGPAGRGAGGGAGRGLGRRLRRVLPVRRRPAGAARRRRAGRRPARRLGARRGGHRRGGRGRACRCTSPAPATSPTDAAPGRGRTFGRPRTAPRSRARTSPASTGGAPSSPASRSPAAGSTTPRLEELVTRRCVFEQCVLTGVRMGGATAPRLGVPVLPVRPREAASTSSGTAAS